MDFLYILKWTSLSIVILLATYAWYRYRYIKYKIIYFTTLGILFVISTLISLYLDETVRAFISHINDIVTYIHANNLYAIILLVFILYFTKDTPNKKNIKIVSKEEMKKMIDKDIVDTLWIVKLN